MKRKGQYLAVESVLTFGLGLIVAIGTVSAFSSYRDQVIDRATGRQVDIVESRIVQAVQTLEETDSGHIQVELPDEIGSQSYTIAMSSDKLTVSLQTGQTYTTRLEQFSGYSFQGSTGGGSVKVFKRGEQFTLRTD